MGNQSVVSSPEEPVSSNPRGSLPSITRQPPRTHGSDRKFNLIVSGIEEPGVLQVLLVVIGLLMTTINCPLSCHFSSEISQINQYVIVAVWADI